MKPALSREFIAPSTAGGQVNRPMRGLAMIMVADMFGAIVLQQQTPPAEFVPWILGLVAVLSLVGGAVYHPIREFWLKGAVAGLAIGAISLVTCYLYVEWRFTLSNSISSGEMLIPLLVGALPGVALYYQMMRHETVEPERPMLSAPRRCAD